MDGGEEGKMGRVGDREKKGDGKEDKERERRMIKKEIGRKGNREK